MAYLHPSQFAGVAAIAGLGVADTLSDCSGTRICCSSFFWRLRVGHFSIRHEEKELERIILLAVVRWFNPEVLTGDEMNQRYQPRGFRI